MYKTIFLGDSFTNCNGLLQSDTWPTIVRRTLNKQFGSRVKLKFETSVATQENTRGALERLQRDIFFAEPNILTVQYGTNDSTYLMSNRGAPSVSQEAFRFNLLELVDKCRLFNIRRLIFITNHPVALDRYDIHGLTPDENTQFYDEIIREVASTSACHLADVRKAMENYKPNELCLDDQIHVNKFGAKIHAETIAPVIAMVLEGLIDFENQQLQVSAKC